ncbi:MAG: hypothetical protein U5K69_16445 [Balneolaceae bacterium]|nr:hypothetical protein [Balneolaceae bacterium]
MKSNEVYIAKCKVSNLDSDELLDAVNEYAQDQHSSDPAVMLSANIHGINQAHKYKWLLRMNNDAELVRNDSAGIQLAGKILGVPIKERMTWADFRLGFGRVL